MEERKEKMEGSSGERRDLTPLHASEAQRTQRRSVCFGKDDGQEDLLNQTSLVLLLCGAWSSSTWGPPRLSGHPALLLPMLLAPPQPFPRIHLQAPSWAQHPFLCSTLLSPVFKA